MVSPRWRKVLRDLSLNKGRTLLVITAITVGVVAAGSILTAYSVITREMDRNYGETNPPSGVLYMDSVDEELVASVEARPEIAAAEARREITTRLIRGSDEWINLRLVVVDDFDDIAVSRFYPEEGAWNPGSDEILIERSSLTEVDMSIGDDITVAATGQSPRTLSVAGLVHDPGRTPAWMVGHVVGYVTVDALGPLGIEPVLDQLQVVAVGEPDRAANRELVDALVDDLRADGLEINRVDVSTPGEHPARGVMRTLLFLLQAFGVLALITSGGLVATLITAQLNQQSREIGVMKAVGAKTGQIAGIYLGTVALLSIAALAVGIPVGILGGRGLVAFTFGLLNFEVETYSPDAWVIPVQIGAALAIALLAVAYPVARSSRTPVHEVLADHGSATPSSGSESKGWLRRPMEWVGRTSAFGLRNAFRARSRTVLTVLAISLGGAAFMVALNTGVAWDRAVDAEFDARQYELEVQLDGAYPVQELSQALADVPPVTAVEPWNQYQAAIQLSDGGRGDTFRLLVPPPRTEMIDYPVLEGRWLRPGEENALVVTQVLNDPAPTVGEIVSMDVDGTTTSWTIVGVVRQMSGGRTGVAYASNRPAGIGTDGSANHVRIDGSESPQLLSAVEQSLAANGIGVANISTAADGRQALDDHLLIIVGLLLIMAILISIVGGLGLIETMSISVLERRRELGVIRAVGATTAKVLQVVIIEGVLIAVLSWALAV
ncbi:MAG: FtsX-like permease family protein, partial [Actinomycetia bacterium]|nr:FtsX-like permease family protein [Actinomycetes bacterium]